MKLVVVTPVRLFGDGLCACLRHNEGIVLDAVVRDLIGLRGYLAVSAADVGLIDVTQGIDLDEVRAIALDYADVALIALGLEEQRQNVVRCGRAGFRGYIDRNATVDTLCSALRNALA